MSWLQILRLPLGLPATRLGLLGLAWVLAIAAMLLPYDHDKHIPHDGKNSRLVLTVEYGLRHVNTALQLGLPLLTRDWTGLRQLAVVAIAAGGTVHGLKRALNDVEIAGTRLGRRPHSANSKHNMPSGHASLAASGAWFVARRYGLRYLWLLGPITLMTMWARVMLDAHTAAATIAGALIGLTLTDKFTTARSSPAP
ncbi:lipid A 1-phosphatase LpxE [Bordetella hinzii]|uniref:lipid A 1-phosphatase LpxE n=1 Tax=Bordetella hinzii TaxID=103855 RepID=UPI0006921BD3|nr:lipid A 1-phosphatase LpxE [Bordetella hinzii]QDJ40742.1 lipid A 1-phosphatase LpxE [Bordetella hinzii]QDJ54211.1 lipid A 1-phosphatase LpxE [Bordetella hinzii]QII83764.1 lipid A 1-phosphatase LpxE [Bordetella hinzii]QWF40379.1 lipid A 1-phosphatase LpxE [Bordetella hinzii]QWF44926.1 lipid A 1-phosphatase LpxE [Bordetella hinzii]